MFARLMIPPKMVAFAKTKGINLKPCEKLRWTDQHPTRPGIGVLLRGKSSEILTEGDYRWLHDFFDATIETDDPWRVVSAFGDFLRWRYDRWKCLPLKRREAGVPSYKLSEVGIYDIRERGARSKAASNSRRRPRFLIC